eukprot:10610484-Alexandrium_andersonii.AAC.1
MPMQIKRCACRPLRLLHSATARTTPGPSRALHHLDGPAPGTVELAKRTYAEALAGLGRAARHLARAAPGALERA